MSDTRNKAWSRGTQAGLLLLITGSFCGCGAHRNVGAETARHLHADVVAYEVLLNDRIAHEKNAYDERMAAIRDEEDNLLTSSVEQFRRHRCAELTSAMASDPERAAQAGNVLRFLNDSVQSEYGLYRRVKEKESPAVAESDDALAKIERHREELAQLEERVAGLGTKGKLRTNNQLLMQDIDDLLDQLENDQRRQVSARRWTKVLRWPRSASKTPPSPSQPSSKPE